jgi:hypothetical protein
MLSEGGECFFVGGGWLWEFIRLWLLLGCWFVDVEGKGRF